MKKYLNKIINNDCFDVMWKLPDECIDLVLTDPPYGINFQSGRRKIKHQRINNDRNLHWLPFWCSEIERITKKDAHLYIFCNWKNIEVFKTELQKHIPIKNILIWVKNNHGMGDLKCDYAPQYEMILYCNRGRKPLNGKRSSNILEYAKTDNKLHPTQKPNDLIEHLIQKSAKSGDVILDTFAGSCPVAFESFKLGLDFICIESNEIYTTPAQVRLNELINEGGN